MRHRLVLYDGDQQGREQDVCHLPVEEVHSVVGLRHHGGLVPAGGVVLHALRRVVSAGAKETGKPQEVTLVSNAAAALKKPQHVLDLMQQRAGKLEFS